MGPDFTARRYMARQARISLPGHAHHLLVRGHNRQPIALDDEDRRRLLACLGDALREHRLGLHAYALAPTRLHLLLTPPTSEAVGRLLQSVGRRYVAGFNARHGRSGTLWEGRYRAHLVADGQPLLACMRYVEQQAKEPEGGWSSLAHHLGQRRDPLLTDPPAYWALGNTPFDREAAYRTWREQGVAVAEAAAIEAALRSGRPWGGAAFLAGIEKQLGRSLARRPRGRPPRSPLDAPPEKTVPIK